MIRKHPSLRPAAAAFLILTFALRPAPGRAQLSEADSQLRTATAGSRTRAEADQRRVVDEETAPPVQIVIYQTTDIHGYFDAYKGDPVKHFPATGGAASLQTLLKSEARPHLWFDSGDWFQGTPESNFSRGDEAMDVLNALGPTAAEVGNHDFDYGMENLGRLVAKARFPVLGSNVGGIPGVQPYILKTIAGVKIGVFGLLTTEMNDGLASEVNIRGASFGGEASAARRMVKLLRDQGAQVVIALTHLGIEEYGTFKASDIKMGDLALAKQAPGIDLILGGHTHIMMDPPLTVGTDGRRTLITQAGSYLKGVYRIVLDVNPKTGAILKEDAHLVKLDPALYPPDATDGSVQKIVDAYKAKVNVLMDAPLEGASAVEMTKNANGEDLVSDWLTDVFRDYGDGHGHPTDVGMINTGGIRYGLPKSDALTYRDVYRIQPFDDDLMATFELSGAALRKTVELSAPQVPGDQVSLRFSGNVRVVYDPAAPAGHKVKSVTVNGTDIDDAKIYTATSVDYVAASELAKKRGIDVRDMVATPVLPRDILAKTIRGHAPIDIGLDGRITVLSGPLNP